MSWQLRFVTPAATLRKEDIAGGGKRQYFIFLKIDFGVRYMYTRAGRILRSLFRTFFIHTPNVSSFQHAVALKVPYYQPHVPMLWLLSYVELNCPARQSNWPLLWFYSTKKCSFSKHFRSAAMSVHVSRGTCM